MQEQLTAHSHSKYISVSIVLLGKNTVSGLESHAKLVNFIGGRSQKSTWNKREVRGENTQPF